MYHARAALTGVATNVRACMAELIANEVDQQGPVLDLSAYRIAVKRERYSYGQKEISCCLSDGIIITHQSYSFCWLMNNPVSIAPMMEH